MRFVAAVGLGLTPLLASAAAGTVPAVAGGGAGLTLTATMAGQDQRLLVGTTHLVTITVADTPGEADLRDIWVGLDDLDPHPLTVTCPAGENGHLSLEPEQSLQCTATVTAEVGYRTLVARARARVPGGGSVAKSMPLHYTGFLPPPPPPAAHAAVKGPMTPEPAAGRPHPAPLAPPPPVAVQADPPGGGEVADPPADNCPDGKPGSTSGAASGCCADSKTGSGTTSGCCADSKAGSSAANGCCADGKTSSGAASGCCASTGSNSANGCCADGTAGSNAGTGCCDSHSSTSGCVKQSLASAGGGSHKNGGLLAFTGLSTEMLATAGGIGLALMAGGALLVRRVSRR